MEIGHRKSIQILSKLPSGAALQLPEEGECAQTQPSGQAVTSRLERVADPQKSHHILLISGRLCLVLQLPGKAPCRRSVGHGRPLKGRAEKTRLIPTQAKLQRIRKAWARARRWLSLLTQSLCSGSKISLKTLSVHYKHKLLHPMDCTLSSCCSPEF